MKSRRLRCGVCMCKRKHHDAVYRGSTIARTGACGKCGECEGYVPLAELQRTAHEVTAELMGDEPTIDPWREQRKALSFAMRYGRQTDRAELKKWEKKLVTGK